MSVFKTVYQVEDTTDPFEIVGQFDSLDEALNEIPDDAEEVPGSLGPFREYDNGLQIVTFPTHK